MRLLLECLLFSLIGWICILCSLRLQTPPPACTSSSKPSLPHFCATQDSDGSGGGSATHRAAGRQDSCGPLVPDHLNSEQRVRLLSCLDAVRDVVGDTVSDHAIARAVLKHDYDCAAALDAILSHAMAGMPGGSEL